MTTSTSRKTWREILAEDIKNDPPKSNLNGILFSRPHGGYRLAKQSEWGDEYVAFSYDHKEAWQQLSKITGRGVTELKSLPITRVL
jgi:hypothetical protein